MQAWTGVCIDDAKISFSSEQLSTVITCRELWKRNSPLFTQFGRKKEGIKNNFFLVHLEACSLSMIWCYRRYAWHIYQIGLLQLKIRVWNMVDFTTILIG